MDDVVAQVLLIALGVLTLAALLAYGDVRQRNDAAKAVLAERDRVLIAEGYQDFLLQLDGRFAALDTSEQELVLGINGGPKRRLPYAAIINVTLEHHHEIRANRNIRTTILSLLLRDEGIPCVQFSSAQTPYLIGGLEPVQVFHARLVTIIASQVQPAAPTRRPRRVRKVAEKQKISDV